jgi:hypothetical protein
VKLLAHIHRLAAFGPHRQHRLGFVHRAGRGSRGFLFLVRLVVGCAGLG